MSTQTDLTGETLAHPSKDHLTKERPAGKTLAVEKDREWYCEICKRRVTEGVDGVEYGHENKTAGEHRNRCPIRDEQGMK